MIPRDGETITPHYKSYFPYVFIFAPEIIINLAVIMGFRGYGLIFGDIGTNAYNRAIALISISLLIVFFALYMIIFCGRIQTVVYGNSNCKSQIKYTILSVCFSVMSQIIGIPLLYVGTNTIAFNYVTFFIGGGTIVVFFLVIFIPYFVFKRCVKVIHPCV